MPTCVNHPKATYKGSEPSPKGLGYCARAENVGTEMKGKDGRVWIVLTNKNGTKRWQPKPKKIKKGKKGPTINFRMVI